MSASVGDLLDGVRYSLTGLLFGTAAGTLTELVADEVVAALQLENGPGHKGPLLHVIAEAMVRTTTYSIGLLLAAQMYRSLGGRTADPTDAAMFAYAYTTSQDDLYRALVDLGIMMKQEVVGKGGSCCDGCARSGGACGGAK